MIGDDRLDEERLFLKRCHEGDRDEIQRFVTRSCMGAVSLAIRSKLANLYSKDDIRRIINLCAGHIYANWCDVPSRRSPLHDRITQISIKFAVNYRRKELETRSP
jgi:hypothetical protein